jgi:uncharacterized membrane protein YeiH
LILQKEIYATACFAGALLLFIFYLAGVPLAVSIPVAILSIILIRILAVRYQWSLPVFGNSRKK